MAEPYIAQITLFAGTFAPRGWAYCAGQILPINQNQALFSLLGTTYGGDGRTTYGLPDLRGRTPRGSEGNARGPGLSEVRLGQKAGAETHTVTLQQLPSHNHPLTGAEEDNNQTEPANGRFGNSSIGATYYVGNENATVNMSPLNIQNTGGSQPYPILNPYLGLNYIIALIGLYPSRN